MDVIRSRNVQAMNIDEKSCEITKSSGDDWGVCEYFHANRINDLKNIVSEMDLQKVVCTITYDELSFQLINSGKLCDLVFCLTPELANKIMQSQVCCYRLSVFMFEQNCNLMEMLNFMLGLFETKRVTSSYIYISWENPEFDRQKIMEHRILKNKVRGTQYFDGDGALRILYDRI